MRVIAGFQTNNRFGRIFVLLSSRALSIYKTLPKRHLYHSPIPGTKDDYKSSIAGQMAKENRECTGESRKKQFENLFKIMNANLLAPELEIRHLSSSLPSAKYPMPPAVRKIQRSESPVGKILRPLDQLSRRREHLYSTRILTGGHRASSLISRFVFEGDQWRESPIRIGIFAGLRGDDQVGPGAISAFLADLVALPDLGNDLRLYAYPIVSAPSFETGASSSRSSRYIINQIGCKLLSPETYQIEREIFAIAFDGIITIQIAEEINNMRVAISDPHLHDVLVEPILSSLKPFLPDIDAEGGDTCRSLTKGTLRKQRPFELTLRVPLSGWRGLYAIAVRIALHTAVDCYRSYVTQNERRSGGRMSGALRTT
jgi:hypothetical protein